MYCCICVGVSRACRCCLVHMDYSIGLLFLFFGSLVVHALCVAGIALCDCYTMTMACSRRASCSLVMARSLTLLFSLRDLLLGNVVLRWWLTLARRCIRGVVYSVGLLLCNDGSLFGNAGSSTRALRTIISAISRSHHSPNRVPIGSRHRGPHSSSTSTRVPSSLRIEYRPSSQVMMRIVSPTSRLNPATTFRSSGEVTMEDSRSPLRSFRHASGGGERD